MDSNSSFGLNNRCNFPNDFLPDREIQKFKSGRKHLIQLFNTGLLSKSICEMSENQSSKRQKSVLGPVDDDAFGPDDNATSPLQLKRQDTLPEMVIDYLS